nr:hypothetical protein BaRGS_013438 [Batillaria attramentaria]KAG5691019.1 hypothetical protein BaRGS_005146 [Batillaria attramentaria]
MSISVWPFDGPVGEDGSYQCPETHFQCHNNGYCMPVFVRCNGVYDCPGKEDEVGCSDGDYKCPGFYRRGDN